MKSFLPIAVLAIVCLHVHSQPIPLAVDRLWHFKGNIHTDYSVAHPYVTVTDLPSNFQETGQQIIKTGGHIYLCIDGTGRVYELKQTSHGHEWNRVDSTQFYGYNFNSIYFGYKNELYSFGGYGYWRSNGHLRKFNPKAGDWELVRLEQEVPYTYDRGHSFFYLDSTEGKIYLSNPTLAPNEHLIDGGNNLFEHQIACLDLQKKSWSFLERQNDFTPGSNIPTSFGVFTGAAVLDLKNNTVYELSETFRSNIKSILGKMNRNYGMMELYYCSDSTLYYGNSKGFLDSVILHQSDLIPTNQSIYKENSLWYISLILLAVSALVTLLYWYKKPRKSLQNKDVSMKVAPSSLKKEKPISPEEATEPPAQEPTEETPLPNIERLETLDSRERELYLYISKKSEEGKTTTVEEINQLIGCSQRNLEVQKRMRSDVIISINNKLKLAWGVEGVVINKKRAEFDKRSYEYFIENV